MSIRERLSGNEASAVAMRQINPDVVAAFPITPSTEIPQYFSTFVANGTVDTEFVAVESEHSAMSACIGAEAAGAGAPSGASILCQPGSEGFLQIHRGRLPAGELPLPRIPGKDSRCDLRPRHGRDRERNPGLGHRL